MSLSFRLRPVPLVGSAYPPRAATIVATMSNQAQTTVQDDSLKTVNVCIKGTVQGVFYRQWTVETARHLGLNGWVRNRKNGSVEAVFSGKPALVDDMIEKCRRGPTAARVSGVEVCPCNTTVPKGFEKRPTE